MTTTDTRSCKAIRMHVKALRVEREQAKEHLFDHFRALQSKRMRGTLLKDAVYDAVLSTRPVSFVAGLFKSWNR